MMALDYLTIEPPVAATAAVIWMHGLGASGYDFYTANLPAQLGLNDANHAVRFIFPHAPERPVTLNNGYVMRAWYDIRELSREGREDLAGMIETQAAINALIAEQITKGTPSEKIFLAGFSQGGAVALYCGLRYAHPLGGIIGLSTYLPFAKNLPTEASAANQETPIFLAHGQYDQIVQLEWGEDSRNHLLNLRYQVDWHVYPMAHELYWDELVDLRGWICTM